MSVNKYKDGRDNPWYCSFYFTDWTGTRHRKKKEGFSLKREAQDFEDEFLKKNTRSCDMLFSSLVEYYRDDQLHRVRHGTLDTEDSIIDKWLLPYFGKLPVNQIDAVAIRLWQNELMSAKKPQDGQPYAPTYLRTINSRLSAIFNYAVRYYRLERNPCLSSGYMGKKKAQQMSFWTLEQFNHFISTVAHGYRVAYLLLYWAGLRKGECLALTPADILPNKTVKVEKTYHRRDGQDLSGPPKTTNSNRVLSIPDFVYDETQAYIKSLYGIQPQDRIFYFTQHTLNHVLSEGAAKAGLPPIRIHDLRHSHAALLIEMGYDIPAVAERLGDTLEVAMSTYIHLYPQKMDHVIANLNQVAAHGLPASPQ